MTLWLTGMLDFLLDTNLDVQQLEFTKIAQASGTALISLINDVLDLAKVETGIWIWRSTSSTSTKLLKKFLMYSGGSFERLVIFKVLVIIDSTIETLHVHSFYGQS